MPLLACLVLALLASGCTSDHGFALEMTVDFDSSVDDDALAEVTSIAFGDTGDETYAQDSVLGRHAKRSERLLYDTTTSAARAATVTITAEAANGIAISSGRLPVTLEAGKTTHVTRGRSTRRRAWARPRPARSRRPSSSARRARPRSTLPRRAPRTPTASAWRWTRSRSSMTTSPTISTSRSSATPAAAATCTSPSSR